MSFNKIWHITSLIFWILKSTSNLPPYINLLAQVWFQHSIHYRRDRIQSHQQKLTWSRVYLHVCDQKDGILVEHDTEQRTKVHHSRSGHRGSLGHHVLQTTSNWRICLYTSGSRICHGGRPWPAQAYNGGQRAQSQWGTQTAPGGD